MKQPTNTDMAAVAKTSAVPMGLKAAFTIVVLISVGLGIARHYIPTDTTVAASDNAPAATPAAAEKVVDANWPLYRGNSLATGVARADLPNELNLLWKFPVENGSFEATAVVYDGTVFVGDLDGVLYAIDLKDGSEKWRFKSPAGFNAAAAIRVPPANLDERAAKTSETPRPLLYVGNMDGTFFCLDVSTGAEVWKFATEAEINSSANFYQDKVLVGSQDATLYCLNAQSGDEVWKFSIEDQIRCMPTVVENRAFLAGCDGRLHIVDLDKGSSVGEVPIDGPTGSTPAVSGDVVYFGTEGGTFYAINWKEAQIVWQFRDSRRNQPFRSSAAVSDSLVLVGGRDKSVRALDLATGDQVWNFATRGRVDSSPVLVEKRAFVGSADGRVYGLDAATGNKVWEYEAGGSFTASPAVANGRLVIASDDGFVYCFGAKVVPPS